MQYYETVHTETADGFDIVFSVTPECEEPDWEFETEQEKLETLHRIETGQLSWFVARVEAYKDGILLGTDYLGGCCYDSPLQFVDASDYYGDMVENAVAEAKNKIATLCKAV